MKIATVKKQPLEKRRYGIDYSEALDSTDEIIQVEVHAIEPAGLTVTAASTTPTFVNVVCEDGVDGVKYKVTLIVVTTDGREVFEDELYVAVKEI